MQKILLVMFFIACANLYSEDYKTVVLWNTANWVSIDPDNPYWDDVKKTYSKYNAEDLFTNEYIEMKNDADEWIPTASINYAYNEDRLQTETHRFTYSNQSWQEVYKMMKSYISINGKNYISEIEEFTGTNGDLKGFQKRKYTYNEEGKIDTVFFYSFLSEDYELININVYQYNEKGDILELIDKKKYGDAFEPSMKATYDYNDSNWISVVTDLFYAGSEWSPVERILYEYDDLGRELVNIEQHHQDNWVFKDFKKYVFAYTPTGKMDYENQYITNPEFPDEWFPSSQFDIEYNENDEQVLTYYNTGVNGEYVHSTKYYYVSTLGVEDEENNESLTVFPNPSNDYILLPFNEYTFAQVINTDGKIIIDNIKKTERINISKLVPGAYFVKILKNNTFTTIPFVVY